MILLLKYLTKTEKTAKSVDEAKAAALAELGIDESDAVITVLDEGSKGFLGIGSKEAKVSLEAKDVNAVIAKSFLSEVFDAMGLGVDITAKTGTEELNVGMSGDRMGLVIGKRGDTLDALQYLTSLVVNRESDERVRVILDTENYREKRRAALLALSKRLAEKVARTGKKHTLEPMNPYERRIIHSALQSNEEVTTFSIGEEPYRKVVIAPQGYSANSGNSHSNKPHYQAPHKRMPKISTAEYRQQNHNKYENFDEFLSGNKED